MHNTDEVNSKLGGGPDRPRLKLEVTLEVRLEVIKSAWPLWAGIHTFYLQDRIWRNKVVSF